MKFIQEWRLCLCHFPISISKVISPKVLAPSNLESPLSPEHKKDKCQNQSFGSRFLSKSIIWFGLISVLKKTDPQVKFTSYLPTPNPIEPFI